MSLHSSSLLAERGRRLLTLPLFALYSSLPPSSTASSHPVSPLDPSTDFPSLSNAETSTALTIHNQIESRPLKKAQAQAEAGAGHHPPSDATTESEVAAEEEEEVGEVEEAVLKDFDTELERVFKILKEVRDQFYEEVERGKKSADVKVRRASLSHPPPSSASRLR